MMIENGYDMTRKFNNSLGLKCVMRTECYPLLKGDYSVQQLFYAVFGNRTMYAYFTGKSDGKRHLIGTRTDNESRGRNIRTFTGESGEAVFDGDGFPHSYAKSYIFGGSDDTKVVIKETVFDKYTFVGLFNHGKRHGFGTLHMNEVIVKGTWKDEKQDGPTEIHMRIGNDERYATIYVNFSDSIPDEFGKVVFDSDKSIYVGRLHLARMMQYPLGGDGILLDENGIHEGEWRLNRMHGYERLHLCDEDGTVITLKHTFNRSNGVVEKEEVGRSTGNRDFRVTFEHETSEIYLLQCKEVAIYIGKRKTLRRLLCVARDSNVFSFQDVCVVSQDRPK